MGNTLPTQAKDESVDQNKLDLYVKQIYFTAQLQRDRKKGIQNFKEKELRELVQRPKNTRNLDNEFSKAASIVNHVKSNKSLELIMIYADVLKDNKTVIQLSKGDTKKINDLVPFVESLIWGCRQCNIDCVKQFEDIVFATFGQESYEQITEFTEVTPELRKLFTSLLPTDREIKLYLIDFCNRNGFSLDIMNEIGHNLDPSKLNSDSDPLDQPPTNPPSDDGGKYGGSEPINNNLGRYPQFDPSSFQQPSLGGYPNAQCGGYPSFQTLQNNQYPQGGFGPDLDAKLDNIKKGL